MKWVVTPNSRNPYENDVTLTEDCPKLYENLYRRESQLLRAYSIAWNLAFFILQYAFVGHAAQRRIYEGPFMSKVFNML
jgi:hypothetical protein